MDSWDYPHSYAHHDDACLRLGGRGRVSPTQCLIGKNCGNRGQSDSELNRGREAVTFHAANAQRDDMGAQP